MAERKLVGILVVVDVERHSTRPQFGPTRRDPTYKAMVVEHVIGRFEMEALLAPVGCWQSLSAIAFEPTGLASRRLLADNNLKGEMRNEQC